MLREVTDGSLYKSLLIQMDRENLDVYHIMLMFNTDGAPVFKSQKYSIWPFNASVQELVPGQKYTVYVYKYGIYNYPFHCME